MNKIFASTLLSLLTLSFATSVYATDVYITIDENGNRIFSDKPSEKSRTHKIKEISIVPAIKINKMTATAIDTETADHSYKQLKIISPAAESHISRDKLGSFIISAQLSPVLQAEDEAVLIFDGEEISSGIQLSWQINSADRGAHTLQVIIRQQGSNQLKISSQIQTVFVKR